MGGQGERFVGAALALSLLAPREDERLTNAPVDANGVGRVETRIIRKTGEQVPIHLAIGGGGRGR